MPTKFKNLILIIVIVLLALFVARFANIEWRSNNNSVHEHVKGLHGTVDVYRNWYGVVKIVAHKSDEDAFFALGFVHAQDRLYQMIFMKNVARGTLSEIFGRTTLADDRYTRAWGFYRYAKEAWPALSKKTKVIIRAYTAGVNYFLKTENMPMALRFLNYRPKPWTVYDTLAMQKMMAWNLQMSWIQELKDYYIAERFGKSAIPVYFPPYPKDAPVVISDKDLRQSGIKLVASRQKHAYLKPAHGVKYPLNLQFSMSDPLRHDLNYQDIPGKGSNAWVVSGKYTVSSLPLLANDLHFQLQAPNQFYVAHLVGPHLNVTGATVPGLPCVLVGFNKHIAWGSTNGYADEQDLYMLPKNAKLKVIPEVIHVRNGKDVHIKVRISKWGPIISDATPEFRHFKRPFALHWAAFFPGDTTVQAWLEMDYAQNWKQFVAALKDYVTPSENFIYADKKGNIGDYFAGHIPVREGWDGSLPVRPGKHWSGMIPFDQLPHVLNPSEGLIISANNKVTTDHYPYRITFYWPEPPYRAERIRQLLIGKTQFSLLDFEAVQTDIDSLYWKRVKAALLGVKPLDKDSALLIKVLRGWDGQVGVSSPGALVFAVWQQQFDKLVPQVVRFDQRFDIKWNNPLYLTKMLYDPRNQVFLQSALKNAAHIIVERFGDNPANWSWGSVHIAKFNELGLDHAKVLGWVWSRSIPSAGTAYTINVGTYNPRTLVQIGGATYRQIVHNFDVNDSQYMIPMGQRSDVFSYDYDNLLPMWANGYYLNFGVNEKSVLSRHMTLKH